MVTLPKHQNAMKYPAVIEPLKLQNISYIYSIVVVLYHTTGNNTEKTSALPHPLSSACQGHLYIWHCIYSLLNEHGQLYSSQM